MVVWIQLRKPCYAAQEHLVHADQEALPTIQCELLAMLTVCQGENELLTPCSCRSRVVLSSNFLDKRHCFRILKRITTPMPEESKPSTSSSEAADVDGDVTKLIDKRDNAPVITDQPTSTFTATATDQPASTSQSANNAVYVVDEGPRKPYSAFPFCKS